MRNREVANALIIGQIIGLLEGWGVAWNEMNRLDTIQRARALELFGLFDHEWIIKTMFDGLPSDRKLLTYLSDLAYLKG